MKGVILLSGGVRSKIATKFLLESGHELIGLHFISNVYGDISAASSVAAELGIKLKICDITADYFHALKTIPPYLVNKKVICLTCRATMIKVADGFARGYSGCEFIATGQVLGKSSIESHRSMALLQKYSQYKIIHPLSARYLPGQSDYLSDKFLAFSLHGRGRNDLRALCRLFKLKESFARPCLLRGPSLLKRLVKLMHRGIDMVDFRLLTRAKHYTIDSARLIIVSSKDKTYQIPADPSLLVIYCGDYIGYLRNISDYHRDCDVVLKAAKLVAYHAKSATAHLQWKNKDITLKISPQPPSQLLACLL